MPIFGGGTPQNQGWVNTALTTTTDFCRNHSTAVAVTAAVATFAAGMFAQRAVDIHGDQVARSTRQFFHNHMPNRVDAPAARDERIINVVANNPGRIWGTSSTTGTMFMDQFIAMNPGLRVAGHNAADQQG